MTQNRVYLLRKLRQVQQVQHRQALKKGLQAIEITCKPLLYLGRHIQTRTGDLYDVKGDNIY